MTAADGRLAVAVLVSVALLAATLVNLRCAAAGDTFYRGKTVIILVGVAPGGSFDLYARLMARHLSDHIAGKPAVIVENKSGAGGLTAFSYLCNVAPRDGTVIEIVPPAIALTQTLKPEDAPCDVRALNWIGRLTPINEVFYTWHTSPSKTLDDLLRRQTLTAGTGPDAGSTILTTLLNDLVHTKFKLINGYNETAAAMLAVERGEVEGVIRPWEGMKAGREREWLAHGDINLVAQFAMERSPELPQVGALGELLKTDRQRRLFRLFLSPNDIGRSFTLGPEVPAPQVATMRTAFSDMLRDPQFLADAAKLKMALDPAPANLLAKRSAETLDAPPDVIVTAKQYYPR